MLLAQKGLLLLSSCRLQGPTHETTARVENWSSLSADEKYAARMEVWTDGPGLEFPGADTEHLYRQRAHWIRDAIELLGRFAKRCMEQGARLRAIDVGGGWPMHYGQEEDPYPAAEAFSQYPFVIAAFQFTARIRTAARKQREAYGQIVASVQESMDLGLVTHLAAIEASVPFVHFFDGFRTSHEINKITLLSDSQIRALINEARLGGQLRHKNIVNTLESDEIDGRYYIALELIDGADLGGANLTGAQMISSTLACTASRSSRSRACTSSSWTASRSTANAVSGVRRRWARSAVAAASSRRSIRSQGFRLSDSEMAQKS